MREQDTTSGAQMGSVWLARATVPPVRLPSRPRDSFLRAELATPKPLSTQQVFTKRILRDSQDKCETKTSVTGCSFHLDQNLMEHLLMNTRPDQRRLRGKVEFLNLLIRTNPVGLTIYS